MRKLLHVLCAMLLLGKLEAASACLTVGNAPSDEELFAKASTVFIGYIHRTEVIETHVALPSGAVIDDSVVRGTFRLVEVLKGEPPADRIIMSTHTKCGSFLVVGLDYLIFLNEGSNIVVSALGTAGTRPMSPTDFRVGELRELSKKAQ